MNRITIGTLAVLMLASCVGPDASARDRKDLRPTMKRLMVSQTPGSAEEESEPERPRDRRLKKRLAVMDVVLSRSGTRAGDTNGSGLSLPLPSGFARGTTRLLTAALARTGRFVVVEREALLDLQEEYLLEESNPPTPEGVMSAGRALGAQYVLHGAITELTYRRSSSGRNSAPGRTAAGRDTARVTLRVHLFNAATGQLSATVRCEGRAWMAGAASIGTRGNSTFGSAAFNNSPLGEATREVVIQAVDGIVEHLEAHAWEGRVAAVEREEDGITRIILHAGSDDGLGPGDEVRIFQPVPTSAYAENGDSGGRASRQLLGTCRIESVQPRTAVAVPLSGETFPEGALVRLRRRGR